MNNKRFGKTAVLLIALIMAFSSLLSIVFCGGESSDTNSDENSDVKENKDNTNEKKKISYKDISLDDSKFEVHYYAQWDFELDYPYNNVDEYWEDMQELGNGFFKFYYDSDGRVVGHERLKKATPLRIARYTYKSDGTKTIKWGKNYSTETGLPQKYDLLEYYPDSKIKSLTEYDMNDDIIMKIEYDKINETENKLKRLARVYDSENREKIYIETIYEENKYSEKPEYLKKKETSYIAFGEYKDRWFSVERFDAGEIDKVDYNDFTNEEGNTLVTYIEKEFPAYFSEGDFYIKN